MGFKEWIVPQDRVFYDLLEQSVRHAAKTVDFFAQMMTDLKDMEDKRQALKGLEHQADEICHEIYRRLGRTFITPLDREDIVALTKRIDDIVDYVDAAGNRAALFGLNQPTDAMVKFVGILQAQMRELVPAIASLRKASTRKDIRVRTIEIHRLENEADRVLNRAIAGLFQTKDPVEILKLKDVYENLENATDRAEDVADVLNDIVRKHG